MVYLPKYRPFLKEECRADPTRTINPFLFIERNTGIMDSKIYSETITQIFRTHLSSIIKWSPDDCHYFRLVYYCYHSAVEIEINRQITRLVSVGGGVRCKVQNRDCECGDGAKGGADRSNLQRRVYLG